MNARIVDSPDPITLVGGGEASLADLQEARRLAPGLVAVDSGAELCRQSGVTPDALIGDLDSISQETRNTIPTDRVHHIAEQESTDLDKALARVFAPLLIGVGFLGARLDHELAALHSLLLAASQPALLIGAQDVICLCPPALELALPKETRLSLFPLVPVQGRSTGLKWPIDDLALAPGQRIGTSNQTTGPVSLWVDAPGLFLVLPREYMSVLAKSLQAAARWPVRDR